MFGNAEAFGALDNVEGGAHWAERRVVCVAGERDFLFVVAILLMAPLDSNVVGARSSAGGVAAEASFIFVKKDMARPTCPTKINEHHTKINEHRTKIDENCSKIDECHMKIDENL